MSHRHSPRWAIGRWTRIAKRGLIVAIVVGAGLLLVGSVLRRRPVDEGRAAYERGDLSTAFALASSRLKAAPGDRDALRLLARAAARQGRDDTARILYTRLGGASAMQAEDFFLFGRLIDRTGDHETARACWVAGLRLDPKNAEILNEFARLYLQGAQLDLAERTAKALAKRPGWAARTEVILAQVADQRDDPSAAAGHLERAFDFDPHLAGSPEPLPYYQKRLARALLGAGRPAEAKRWLGPLIASGKDAEASWLVGRAGLQLGALPEDWGKPYRAQHQLEPEPSPYVGSERCEACHHEQYEAEQSSLHSRTFRRGPALESLPQVPVVTADPIDPNVEHTIESTALGVRCSTRERGRTLRAIVDFAFGSGHRGLTLVGRDDDGRTRELRLSHYADGPAWDITTGHARTPPPSEGYLGRLLSSDDLASCFACHTTAPQLAREAKGPTASDRGIGCERCHGPGSNHLLAVAAKAPDLAIAQPRAASGAAVVALCGQCHNPFHREVNRNDPKAVRFPATTLTWSRCYTESAGNLDCRTCHDPHRDVASSIKAYEAKCRACHDQARPRAVCPVNTREGCIACHMPKTTIGIPHSLFTDHHIRAHGRRNGG
ncbi:MAG: multiheme c-type cytochrome [Isosphaeraceae bacterium]|nr:multiheme c-type cytochrome [Isosphaeraceae bacterium]